MTPSPGRSDPGEDRMDDFSNHSLGSGKGMEPPCFHPPGPTRVFGGTHGGQLEALRSRPPVEGPRDPCHLRSLLHVASRAPSLNCPLQGSSTPGRKEVHGVPGAVPCLLVKAAPGGVPSHPVGQPQCLTAALF